MSAYRHIQKRHGQGHEQRSDQRPVLDSDIERIPEVIENYDSVNFGAKTDRGNDAIVYQKMFSDGTFIAVEEVRKKNRKLGVHTLYIKKPDEVRGEVISLDPTSETAPGFSSEVLQQPSTESIGQNVSNVNSLRAEQRLLEKTEDIAEVNVVRESLNQLPQDAQSSIQKEALQAINETPTMRIQLDEGETSITAAEYLARQEAEAERIKQEAQQGVPEAVACVFLNNGMDQ